VQLPEARPDNDGRCRDALPPGCRELVLQGSARALCIWSRSTADVPSFSTTGWQLGSDPEIQVATLVSNHLTAGLLKYFGDSYRYERVVNLFERLLPLSPEVAALLATSYIGMSEFLAREISAHCASH
jgi:hypothetical protein